MVKRISRRVEEINGIIHYGCTKCGEMKKRSEFYRDSHSIYKIRHVCKECEHIRAISNERREYQRNYSREWIKRKKKSFFDNKICCVCDSSENLMIRSTSKQIKVNNVRPWYLSENLLTDFQVVCKNHFLGSIANHGTSYKYRTGCRCDECKKWRRNADRVWGSTGSEPLPEFYPFIPQGLDAIADSIEGMELLLEVNKSVSKYIPEYIREDICQELLLAVLAGEIQRIQLSDFVVIKKFISRVFKNNTTWDMSLDAPLGEGDERTLLNVLSNPLNFPEE